MSVELKSHQKEHFANILNIISKKHLFIDTSVMGAGKTYTTVMAAKKMKMDIGVICPKGIIMNNWKTVCNLVGVKLHFVINYDNLRSKNCEILEPITVENGEPYFRPKEKIIELFKKPFMLVFDEFHRIKNKSQRSLACSVLTRSALKAGTYTRIAMLSASPYDKVDHIINLMYTMGFMTHKKLSQYNPTTKTLELKAIAEAIYFGKIYNREITETLIANTESYKGTYGREFIHQLFIRVFKPELVSSMPPPNIDTELDIKNGYYKCDTKKQEELVLKAVESLSTATSWRKETDSIARQDNFVEIYKALASLEEAKLPLFVRKAREVLEESGYSKVVIFVNYLGNLEYLKHELEEYGVVDIQGKLTTDQRVANQERFQEPNTNVRVMIGTTATGGVGINLHDTDGRFPRTMLIVPNFSIIDLHQATGRIYRVGTKSNATVRFIYADVASQETRILNALAKKSQILKEMLDTQVDAGVKFPSDYGTEVEQ